MILYGKLPLGPLYLFDRKETFNFLESLTARSLLLSVGSYRRDPGICFGEFPTKPPVLASGNSLENRGKIEGRGKISICTVSVKGGTQLMLGRDGVRW